MVELLVLGMQMPHVDRQNHTSRLRGDTVAHPRREDNPFVRQPYPSLPSAGIPDTFPLRETERSQAMGKGRDIKKDAKKQSTKSLKEKRIAKKAKKAAK